MEKAKKAVANFMAKDGKHKTTVDEDVRSAVTEEHVRPQQHENVTTAIDKEIHQDHHHTTVQPINVQNTLPENHTHKVLPVEHRSFEHGSDKDVKSFLNRDAAQYQNTSVVHDTTTSTSTAPTVTGEHIHHHVHEHIQPVIQKETIAPHVVHTTAPIHETHHVAAVHHGTKVLPAKSLDEFIEGQGKLEPRGVQKKKEYEGCPTFNKKDLESSWGSNRAQSEVH